MRKILYISGTRADFGLLSSTLNLAQQDSTLEVSVCVTGMHLASGYGNTVSEIEEAGLRICGRIPVLLEDTTGASMARALADELAGMIPVLEKEQPDLVLLLGDRGEMLAGALAAIHLNLPVVHIHGGERSGTVDEPVRHAISKLAHYHFAATESSKKRLIKMGDVTVDDVTASNPTQKVTGDEEICIDGSPINMPGHRYFMLNKPAGVVSANKDSDHPTVIDLIYEHRHQELQIAGRLDIDTTGLLLITDDGQWNHRVTSPRSECQKTYLVEAEHPLTNDLIEKFSQGIWLEGEKRRCLPATLEVIDAHHARLSISEGKYHQVKRMFLALGNAVESLHRERIGGIVLDEQLEPGEYRPLTANEIESISGNG